MSIFPAALSLPLPRVCEHTHPRPFLPLFYTPASCALHSRSKVLLLVFKSLNRSSTLDLLGLQHFHPLRSQRSASLVDKQPVTFPPNLKVFLNLDFKYILHSSSNSARELYFLSVLHHWVSQVCVFHIFYFLKYLSGLFILLFFYA